MSGAAPVERLCDGEPPRGQAPWHSPRQPV